MIQPQTCVSQLTRSVKRLRLSTERSQISRPTNPYYHSRVSGFSTYTSLQEASSDSRSFPRYLPRKLKGDTNTKATTSTTNVRSGKTLRPSTRSTNSQPDRTAPRTSRPDNTSSSTNEYQGTTQRTSSNPKIRFSGPISPREDWKVQQAALKRKFKDEAWAPRKRLSPDTLEGIRHLNSTDPAKYTTPFLAQQFEVSPEVIRRILKSKWRPDEKEDQERRERWARRHDRLWDRKVELGLRPPRTEDRKVMGVDEGGDDFDELIMQKRALEKG
ncbi:hypothetical protein BT93_L0095 [Corymbia citriodora subsp. variegata]|uniref:Required for respiratory growth protein 9, mitochondrial n=1 Tax=Corymbia citriodora subsp. variegata TaxID=360336 RepID=A0A8T0CIX5_CORYI|nr:hypothetical protein BT93_L0095 [Corymbia citriodora subsp. variegata]